MDEDRDKFRPPGPGEPEKPEDKSRGEGAGLPEEANEIIEIVGDEEDSVPADVPSASAPDPDRSARELRSLQAKLDRKDQQIGQVMEAYRAKKAETEKLRKRIEKTERRRFEQSKGDFIARFVEVLDNLDRAIDSIENNFDPDAVLQGIMLVRFRLVQLLKEEGLEKIFVRGQPFDPAHSEAAAMESVTEAAEDGVVIKELQPGYMLKGSLLRAARVVVGRYDGDGGDEDTSPKEPSLESGSTEPSPADEPSTSEEDENWETDVQGQRLEFSEDGLDFSND